MDLPKGSLRLNTLQESIQGYVFFSLTYIRISEF